MFLKICRGDLICKAYSYLQKVVTFGFCNSMLNIPCCLKGKKSYISVVFSVI